MKHKKEKVETPKFYSLSRILAKNATLLYGIKEYLRTGKQMVYIRRWREDLRGKRAESLFSNHVANGVIQELTNGKFNEVFTCRVNGFFRLMMQKLKKRVPDSTPFCLVSVYQNKNMKSLAVTRT